MFDGSWAAGGEELVLADILAGRLLRYDRHGSHVGSVIRPGRGALEFDRPVEISEGADGFILVNRTDHLLGLTRTLEPAWGVPLKDLELPGSERVTFVNSVVGSREQLIALLRIDGGDTGRWWGFGRLTLGEPARIDRLAALPAENSTAGDLYSMVMPLVAKAGAAVYALRFEDRPHIQRLLPSVQRLAAFPTGYERVPALPRRAGPAADEARFRALEMATMPEALFGRNESLYLLTRQGRADGGPIWNLHHIDPEKDELVRSIRLPTNASHVVVIPGPLDWAIVDKGPVRTSGEQDVASVIFIPASWIEDPRASDRLAGCLPEGTP